MKNPTVRWTAIGAAALVCAIAVVVLMSVIERDRSRHEELRNKLQEDSLKFSEEMAKVGR